MNTKQRISSIVAFSLCSLFLVGCYTKPASVKPTQLEKPNILWLVVEDMSPYLSMYGDNTVETPAIESLADQGITFTNVFSPSGVCAPSRAALAMGMYPSSFGANHMRTKSHTEVTGLAKYEAVPPANARMLSQYMRENGYYTTNNYKTDYQFNPPATAWHESSLAAHWRHRPAGMPFFSVINFTTTHESGLFEPYGLRINEQRHKLNYNREEVAKLPKSNIKQPAPQSSLPKDTIFKVPPYLPNNTVVQHDLWKMYNNIIETDKQIHAVLEQLKADGLMDSTIIVFYADHGGPLPRQKRLVYDSGLKVPFIIRYPDGRLAGQKDDRLISFVDFLPITLAQANIEIPSHIQGRDVLNTNNKREYIHAAGDRFDGFTDTIRAVRDKRFKYIRNYKPQQGYYLPVSYREKIPAMQSLLKLRDAGKLTPEQAQWFRQSKPKEELFDTINDPHELVNLAQQPAFLSDLNRLRAEMDRWLARINDNPELSEKQLITQLWQGADTQPVTAKPHISIKQNIVSVVNQTKDAVIEYRIAGKDNAWQPYHKAITLLPNTKIDIRAHRIGYVPSQIVSASFK